MTDHLSTAVASGTYRPDAKEHLSLNDFTNTPTSVALFWGMARLDPAPSTRVAWGVAIYADVTFAAVDSIQELNLETNGQIASAP